MLEFEKFLIDVSLKNSYSKVQVISHSMGGLITFATLNKNPELFSSVLFAATPFHQGISFIEDLHAGKSTGVNSKILSPQVLFTFPSVFTFFPFKNEPKILRYDGKSNDKFLDIDLFDAEDWVKYKISVFADQPNNETYKAHLVKVLHNARVFRDRWIKFKKDVKYPPISVLAAKNHPTKARIFLNGPKSIKGLDFATHDTFPGDGRVTIIGSTPPEGIQYQTYETTSEHSSILDDPIVHKIINELTDREKIFHQYS